MPIENVNWKKELDELLLTTRTPEEAAATKAFANAIGPYLDNTELLRTLLGKIQSHLNVNSVRVIADKPKFNNLENLKKSLPEDIEVIDIR